MLRAKIYDIVVQLLEKKTALTHLRAFGNEDELSESIVTRLWNKVAEVRARISERSPTYNALTTVPVAAAATPPSKPYGDVLWDNQKAQELAEKAYQTHFIQGMRQTLLDPNDYAKYNLQDIVYLNVCCKNLIRLSLRAKKIASTESDPAKAAAHEALHDFIIGRVSSYTTYYQGMLKDWNLSSVDSIKITEPTQKYIDLQNAVYSQEKLSLIYCLLVMLPCETLWRWIACRMKKSMDDDKAGTHLYRFWVDGNLPSSYDPANPTKHVTGTFEKTMNAWLANGWYTVDDANAQELYNLAMQCENDLFNSIFYKNALDIPQWISKA